MADKKNYLREKITWKPNADPHHPYQADCRGDALFVRLNDFPDENLYTLLVNDVEVARFNDWPVDWTKG